MVPLCNKAGEDSPRMYRRGKKKSVLFLFHIKCHQLLADIYRGVLFKANRFYRERKIAFFVITIEHRGRKLLRGSYLSGDAATFVHELG